MRSNLSKVVCVVLVVGLLGCEAGDPGGAIDPDWGLQEANLAPSDEYGSSVVAENNVAGMEVRVSGDGTQVVDILADPPPSQRQQPYAVTQSNLDRRAEVLLSTEAGTRLPVQILLQESPFDFSALRNASPAQREAIFADRRAQLAPHQNPVEDALTSLGAIDVYRMWSANGILAQVRVEDLSAIENLPEVVAVLVDPVGGASEYTDLNGVTMRGWTNTDSFLDAGYWGNTSNRVFTNSPVRIGVVDTYRGDTETGLEVVNNVNAAHVGWLDAPGSASRLKARYQCDATTCGSSSCCSLYGYTSYNTHSTRVAAIAAGSIEQGQDPNVTDTTERIERSGIAREADVYYYRLSPATLHSDAIKALELAQLNYVDVMVMPMSLSAPFCDPDYFSLLNLTISSVTNAGMLIVKSAGNANVGTMEGLCNITYPAERTEVLAVGALDTSGSALTGYTSVDLLPSSSDGSMTYYFADGTAAAQSIVDMVAPGVIGLVMGGYPSQYTAAAPGPEVGGTSFSAPQVAAAAALFKETWLQETGVGVHGGNLLANVLLFADGDIGPSYDVYRMGYGRLRAHLPWSGDLAAPWGWGWRSVVLSNGDEVQFTVGADGAEPVGVTQHKWVVTWFESNLGAIADVDAELIDTCPSEDQCPPDVIGRCKISGDCRCPGGPSGDAEFLVGLSAGDSVRKRISTTDMEDSWGNRRCLEMRIMGTDIPQGQNRVVYSADYYHSGDPQYH